MRRLVGAIWSAAICCGFSTLNEFNKRSVFFAPVIQRRKLKGGDESPHSKIMRLREKLSRWLRGSKDKSAKAPSKLDDSYDDDSVDPFNPFPQPITIEISDVFDLHTIAPRDVKLVVEEYLLESRRMGFRSVRIIHGKGIGVQRDMVRSILNRTPFVIDFTDAPPEAGGIGATIAHLSLKDD